MRRCANTSRRPKIAECELAGLFTTRKRTSALHRAAKTVQNILPYRLRRLGRAALCGLGRHYPVFRKLVTAPAPLRVERFACGPTPARELMVLLPGIGDVLEDFEFNRFVADVQACASPADIVAVDLHAGYYFQSCVLERLDENVIRPAQACGYERISLIGISLGGFGALHYARARTADIHGLVLLAPYLGEKPLVDEIADAGGVARWQPERTLADDPARDVWAWLRECVRTRRSTMPEIHLAFGDRDCFASANALLADVLPPNHVFRTRGGHDWRTWRVLWKMFLAERDRRSNSAQRPVLNCISGSRTA